jgi:hypothetical protein
MRQRPAYQALLALMTVALAAGAVWLLLGPSASSGVDDANQVSAGGLVSLSSATAFELPLVWLALAWPDSLTHLYFLDGGRDDAA